MADLIDQGIVDAIINTPFFQTALKGLPIDTKIAVERSLNASFAQGLGIKQIVQNLVNVLESSFKKAETTIRTESHRLSELGHNQEFLDAKNQGVDTKMKLLATLDGGVRPQSAQMDGQISNDEGKFKYPNGTVAIPGNTGNPAYDINDRERSIQIIDGVSPEIRRSREDGIIPYQTFEEWSKARGLTKNVYGVTLFP